jgi:hypothetical protein
MMIHRTHVVTAVVCIVMLLTLGVGWFAFGQNTNTLPELPVGMETPQIRDITLQKEVESLAERVDVLETTVGRLENELNAIKTTSNKK